MHLPQFSIPAFVLTGIAALLFLFSAFDPIVIDVAEIQSNHSQPRAATRAVAIPVPSVAVAPTAEKAAQLPADFAAVPQAPAQHNSVHEIPLGSANVSSAAVSIPSSAVHEAEQFDEADLLVAVSTDAAEQSEEPLSMAPPSMAPQATPLEMIGDDEENSALGGSEG